MHMVIYTLVEASTQDDALATGKTVFNQLVGAVSHTGAVFDYYVTFDEIETIVAGTARWGDLPVAVPWNPTRASSYWNVAERQLKMSSSGTSTG